MDVVHAVTLRRRCNAPPVARVEFIENGGALLGRTGRRQTGGKVGSLQERSVGMNARANPSGSPCLAKSAA